VGNLYRYLRSGIAIWVYICEAYHSMLWKFEDASIHTYVQDLGYTILTLGVSAKVQGGIMCSLTGEARI